MIAGLVAAQVDRARRHLGPADPGRGHHRPVAGAARRLRRPDVAVPDELRRHRRPGHGPPRRAGASWALLATLAVAGVVAARGAARPAPGRHLPGPGHRGVRRALDQWIFRLPELPPRAVRPQLFGHRLGAVDRSTCRASTTERARVVLLAVVFALLYLLVVAVRRSTFGHRLMAIKDSPPPAPPRHQPGAKLLVFAFSAPSPASAAPSTADARLGHAQTVRFLQSLPLLLLAVVGGSAARRAPVRRRPHRRPRRSSSTPWRPGTRTSTGSCRAPWASRSAATPTASSPSCGAGRPAGRRSPCCSDRRGRRGRRAGGLWLEVTTGLSPCAGRRAARAGLVPFTAPGRRPRPARRAPAEPRRGYRPLGAARASTGRSPTPTWPARPGPGPRRGPGP